MASKTTGKDLSEFDALQKRQDEGIDVPIKGPDGESLGFSIKIAGPDSERQRKAAEKLADERMASENAAPLSAADLAVARVRGLAMSTISWTPFQLDGAELPCTEENALKLYQRFAFIRDQVDAKAGRRAAFLQTLKDAAKPQ